MNKLRALIAPAIMTAAALTVAPTLMAQDGDALYNQYCVTTAPTLLSMPSMPALCRLRDPA